MFELFILFNKLLEFLTCNLMIVPKEGVNISTKNLTVSRGAQSQSEIKWNFRFMSFWESINIWVVIN